MKRTKYNTIPLNLASAALQNTEIGTPDRGRCIGIAVVNGSADTITGILNIGITASNGEAIVQPVDHRILKRGEIGGYNGFIPVNFETNGKVKVNISRSSALAQTFIGQLVLVIEINDEL
ncbi:hypothetical protein ACFQ1M_09785 [Sungkyunkwania multivorans]|uniref:Uncharacterized protein n=1 Tax=Sungkyunkwania multivorans TaxID=1173618 RepID=A0ABW3CZ62_9FLAO